MAKDKKKSLSRSYRDENIDIELDNMITNLNLLPSRLGL